MRKILIVVDMQNDFISGSLGSPEAQAIVKPVTELISHYRPEDIIVTRDTHSENYPDTQEGRHLPVLHCIENTEGWQLHPDIAAAVGNARIINKPSFGSLALAEAAAEMAEKEELEITLCGLCTDICVVSNALLLKARLPETTVRLAEKCCAGVTPESHSAAVETMKMCQVDII